MMEIGDKLKGIIFGKLYKDLAHVELIPTSNGSLWFIDREQKYWYLELEEKGTLWWRHDFFSSFFDLFSMPRFEYEVLIKEWVEDILNKDVLEICGLPQTHPLLGENILSREVITTGNELFRKSFSVDDILNRKVASIRMSGMRDSTLVIRALNHRIESLRCDRLRGAIEERRRLRDVFGEDK